MRCKIAVAGVRPNGLLFRVSITAVGRRIYTSDKILVVQGDSAKFYGTLWKGSTQNDAGELLMTVEQVEQ